MHELGTFIKSNMQSTWLNLWWDNFTKLPRTTTNISHSSQKLHIQMVMLLHLQLPSFLMARVELDWWFRSASPCPVFLLCLAASLDNAKKRKLTWAPQEWFTHPLRSQIWINSAHMKAGGKVYDFRSVTEACGSSELSKRPFLVIMVTQDGQLKLFETGDTVSLSPF